MSEISWVENVSEADFQHLVIDRSATVPVVVDFWADWCEPCKQLAPLLEQIAEEYGGAFILAKINTDQCQNLMMTLQIQSIPLVIAFKNGQPAQHFMGVQPEADVREFFKQVLPGVVPGSPAPLEEAPCPTEGMTAQEAETFHRAKLAEDQRDQAALVGLAGLLLERGEDDAAAELLDRAEPDNDTERLQAVLFLRKTAHPFGDVDTARETLAADSDNAQRRFELGCALVAAGDYPDGLAELLAAAQADRSLARETVKEVMVQTFYAVGSRSDLADSYRQQLTLLLY
jgi:putative thioredoxin